MRGRPLRLLALAALAFVTVAHGSGMSQVSPVEVASATVVRKTPPSQSGSGATQTPKPDDPGAAGDSTDPLTISSVTPWVAADGEFQIRFAPTTKIPPDAQLTYTIHQSLVATRRQSLRSKLLDIINGGPTGKVLQAPVTRTLADYGDPANGAVVTIPIRSSSSSDSTRAFLPNSGIHPVDMVLTTADGPELWSQVVFLNRLPREKGSESTGSGTTRRGSDGSTRPVTVSMILPIQADPVFTAASKPEFPLDSRFVLDSITELLDKVGVAPLRLGLRPDTFAGLTRVDEKWAQNLVAAIGRSTGAEAQTEPGEGNGTTSTTISTTTTTAPADSPDDGTGASVNGAQTASLLTLPFVNLDLGGLANPDVREGAPGVLRNQLTLGSKVVADVADSHPRSTTWVLDDSITNESLSLIRSMEFTDVAVPASRIETTGDLDKEQVMTGPVQLDGSGGIRAIAYDDVISQQLGDPSVSPAIRAHDALALLMSNWFTANHSNSRTSVPTSVVVLPPTTDAEVVRTMAAALSGEGPLRSSSGSSLLPSPTTGVDEPVTRLTSRPLSDIAGVVAQSAESVRQINAVDSMSQSAEPALETWRFLDAETFAIDMSPAERGARHNTIRSEVALKFGAIETPPARKVLLGARQTTIPLRFRNNLPYEVRLRMQARSPRLDVRSKTGDMIVLEPGGNRIDLPVSVQAPGESLLRARLSTPDGAVDLASFEIPVSSTSISGVGSALSIISIVFLLLWWIHTLRKRRRESGRATSQHPSTGPADADGPAGSQVQASDADAPISPAAGTPDPVDPDADTVGESG